MPAILAVVVAVLLVGGIVVAVVKSQSDTDHTKTVSEMLEATTTPSTPSQSPAATPPVPSDPAAMMAALKAASPVAADLGLIKRLDGSEIAAGTHWVIFDEQNMSPEQTASSCAPGGATTALGGFGRQWTLVDANGGVHAQALVRVLEHGTKAAARAAVEARETRAFRACHLVGLEADLRTEAQSNDVDPPYYESTQVPPPSAEAGTVLRTYENYRIHGQSCTQWEDDSWQQVGTRVVATTFSTCGMSFEPDSEDRLEARIESHLH